MTVTFTNIYVQVMALTSEQWSLHPMLKEGQSGKIVFRTHIGHML